MRLAQEDRGRAAAWLLALMIFLAPALGVPGEEVLQDTFKSAIVSFCTLGAALVFLASRRFGNAPLRWHDALWLPLLLLAHALASMAWSHTYLAGVEAVRWFVFALVAWLGLNTFTRDRLPVLAACIHAGAVAASLWAALQFRGGLELFPQGPQPASTFVNRNFFAEFAVCTLPFSMLLLARARSVAGAAALAMSNGLVVTALLMTGTRSALAAMALQSFVLLPLVAWRCRGRFAASWRARSLAGALFAGTVLALGTIPTTSMRILEEGQGATPLARGLHRTHAIAPGDYSLGVRMDMWRATLRAIRAEPVTGLGAGAWEAKIPLYQADGEQVETDYYVHDEFLQLVAEYGVVGWLVLLLLAAWLGQAAKRTWRGDDAAAQHERPWRAAFLCSLAALMVVSAVGFPWRLAGTGALFALCVGGLAASDARLGVSQGIVRVRPLPWSPAAAHAGIAAILACLLLATLITVRAVQSERRLVRAVNLAVAISASGKPDDPRHADAKREVLRLVAEGIALNPHYRKLTPMVADELARWGDWRDATWIWDSVLRSRPWIVAIITNAARGHSSIGDQETAFAYLERAQRLQPNAPAVRSLEVLLLARAGKEATARQRAQEALAAGIRDYDLVNAAFLLAWRARDYPQAEALLEQRMAQWPESRALGLEQRARMRAEQP